MISEPYDIERELENDAICDQCGELLDGNICHNCDLFDPEIDAWTAND